jgi:hypothetical protein
VLSFVENIPMKKTLFLITALLYAAFSFAQGSNGLVAHWNFNGNANDVSGNNLNGIVAGAQLVPGYNNTPNSAYCFGGIDMANNTYHNITVPYNSLMNVTSYSISALVRPEHFNSAECQSGAIFWRGTQGANDYYALFINDNEYDLDCFTYTPDKMNFISDVTGSAWSFPGLKLGYNTYVDTNKWYCVTSTYDGDTLKLYVDGVLYNTGVYHSNLQNGIEGLRFGANYGEPIVAGGRFAYPYAGLIDDVKLYNRELNITEVGLYCDTAKLTQGDGPGDTSNYIANVDFVRPLVSPNPAHNVVNVMLPSVDNNGYVQIVNAMGQIVDERKLTEKGLRFDMGNKPTGVYIVRAYYNGQFSYTKFLKE